MRLAARFAVTWVTVDGRGADEAHLARLDEVCVATGRDPRSLGRLVLIGFAENPLRSLDAFARVRARYAALGFTDLVLPWPPPPRAPRRYPSRSPIAGSSASRRRTVQDEAVRPRRSERSLERIARPCLDLMLAAGAMNGLFARRHNACSRPVSPGPVISGRARAMSVPCKSSAAHRVRSVV